jgi:hypothetical protein
MMRTLSAARYTACPTSCGDWPFASSGLNSGRALQDARADIACKARPSCSALLGWAPKRPTHAWPNWPAALLVGRALDKATGASICCPGLSRPLPLIPRPGLARPPTLPVLTHAPTGRPGLTPVRSLGKAMGAPCNDAPRMAPPLRSPGDVSSVSDRYSVRAPMAAFMHAMEGTPDGARRSTSPRNLSCIWCGHRRRLHPILTTWAAPAAAALHPWVGGTRVAGGGGSQVEGGHSSEGLRLWMVGR